MKTISLLSLLFAATLFASPFRVAAQSVTNASPIRAELEILVRSVQDKVSLGKDTETDLAPELQRFDALLAKARGAKSEEAAQVAFFKALMYLQIFGDLKKGTALIEQVRADYSGTVVSQQAAQVLATLDAEQAARTFSSSLVAGATFPDFTATNLLNQAVSAGSYTNKVVLVDFWATWCGPCQAEAPALTGAYKKYHGDGLEIIGISLDSDRKALANYLAQQPDIAWPQVIDGETLAEKYGVDAIPFNFLIGKDGKIIGKDLHGGELADALSKALGHPDK